MEQKDLLKNERLSSSKYKAIVKRYVYNKPWVETAVCKEKYVEGVQKNNLSFRANNLQELAKIYEKRYSSIFKSIKRDGILPANGKLAPAFNCIDEQGEICYTDDGNHGLIMTMVLEIKQFPTKV